MALLGGESVPISYMYFVRLGRIVHLGRKCIVGSMDALDAIWMAHLSWAVTRLELLPMVLLETCRCANQQY